MRVYRAMINQPSTNQPHHKLHATIVIVEDRENGTSPRVHFTTGAVHSMLMNRLCFDEIKISKAS